MKFFITVFILFILFSSKVHSQNYNWITPNKPYLKLNVIEDGVYRLIKNDFSQAGVNADQIDPRTVKLLYKGNQQPLYFEGESDGVFNDNDYIDFYATRNYGGAVNVYREVNQLNVVHYVKDEYYSQYSDTNVYWIEWGGSFGQRISISNSNLSSPSYSQNYFFKKIRIENDEVFSLGLTSNPNADFRYFNTERVTGEGWYWRLISNIPFISLKDTINGSFHVSNLNSSANCSMKIWAIPNSHDVIVNNYEHGLEISINGNPVDTIWTEDFNIIDTSITFPSSVLTNGNNSIRFRYISISGFVGTMYFDYAELNYPQSFSFFNNQINFSTNSLSTDEKVFTLSGFNSSNPVYIYDVKNNLKIINPSVSGSELKFSGKENGKFEVINKNNLLQPYKILQKSVPDLVSSGNGADYLVVYNKLFESQAEQLRNYREIHDGYRSFKAEIGDIYDVFNFGIEDPAAVRNFTRYAYNSWQQPAVKYLCLFGRGSLDPKKIKSSSEYYQNLIPVYGNPPTDGYFSQVTTGSFTYFHDIAVGRLPAYTVQEAQDYVNKIIQYDATVPQDFWKRFLFITGGKNASEQQSFQAKAEALINSYINPSSVSGEPHRVYRNDSSGYITYNYKDSIKREIDRGALIVNFIGHAASQDWEIGLEEPNTLSNFGKLPLIFSMTCFTGKNSETESRSFGEKFISLRDKGAIGFIGTTGWSYSGIGNDYNDFMLRVFARDSIRSIGELLKGASKILGADTINSIKRNTINSYNLLGDPATKLLMPPYPEFHFNQSDFKISNQFPSTGEKVNVTVYPANLGTFADSCKVGFHLVKNQTTIISGDTLALTNFGYKDSLSYSFTLDSLGNYSLKVILDIDNRYPSERMDNNTLSIPVTLRNISFIPMKPVNNEAINSDSVKFIGLNPNVDPAENQVMIMLQVDTSSSFSQPFFNSSKNVSGGITSEFKARIPFQDTNIVYYWRTNSKINGTETGWSEMRKFLYSPNIFSSSDSVSSIYIKFPQQLDPDAVNGLKYEEGGFSISSYKGNLYVHSLGSFLQEVSYFIVNNHQIFIDNGENKGLNILKVSKLFGDILEFKNFRMTSNTSSDSVINFLNTFDTTHILLSLKAHDIPGTDSLNSNARQKFRELGSEYIDSVGSFSWFNTWAFISYPENNSFTISENFFPFTGATNNCPNNWCPSNASMNPEFNGSNGNLNMTFGPSHHWQSFLWKQNVPPNSSIDFDIFGIDRDFQFVEIISGITTNKGVDLSNINSYNFPSLYLRANIEIDSTAGASPVFYSMNLSYVSPAELAVDAYSIEKTDHPVQEGDSVFFRINYSNAGFVNARGVVNEWYVIRGNQTIVLKSDTVNEQILPGEIKTSEVNFSTAGLRTPDVARDTVKIFFESKMLNDQNELFGFNNSAESKFIVTGDSLSPNMEITYDGNKINNGDYVKANPVIEVKFFDDSRMVIQDTSNIKVYKSTSVFPFLIFKYVPYYLNGVKNPELDFVLPDNNFLQATVIYKPSLNSGEHAFRYIAYDNTGNFADSITHNVVVDPELHVLDMYNYPNPMQTSTTFTFNLSGETNPVSFKIKIYTVAGRMIKEINAPASVGFNQVPWDGRDADGDFLANGTYLYKAIIQGNTKTETTIKKLVILR